MAQEELQTKNALKDELSLEIEAEQRKKLNEELEAFKLQLKTKEGHKERYISMVKRDHRLYEIMLDNFKFATERVPTWEFEKIAEYTEIKKDQLNDKYIEDKVMSEGKVKSYDQELTAIQEQIDSCERKLKELDE